MVQTALSRSEDDFRQMISELIAARDIPFLVTSIERWRDNKEIKKPLEDALRTTVGACSRQGILTPLTSVFEDSETDGLKVREGVTDVLIDIVKHCSERDYPDVVETMLRIKDIPVNVVSEAINQGVRKKWGAVLLRADGRSKESRIREEPSSPGRLITLAIRDAIEDWKARDKLSFITYVAEKYKEEEPGERAKRVLLEEGLGEVDRSRNVVFSYIDQRKKPVAHFLKRSKGYLLWVLSIGRIAKPESKIKKAQFEEELGNCGEKGDAIFLARAYKECKDVGSELTNKVRKGFWISLGRCLSEGNFIVVEELIKDGELYSGVRDVADRAFIKYLEVGEHLRDDLHLLSIPGISREVLEQGARICLGKRLPEIAIVELSSLGYEFKNRWLDLEVQKVIDRYREGGQVGLLRYIAHVSEVSGELKKSATNALDQLTKSTIPPKEMIHRYASALRDATYRREGVETKSTSEGPLRTETKIGIPGLKPIEPSRLGESTIETPLRTFLGPPQPRLKPNPFSKKGTRSERAKHAKRPPGPTKLKT